MGCGLAQSKKIQVNPLIKKLSASQVYNIHKLPQFNYVNRSLMLKLNSNSLLNIIDYLSFVELKEIGKINRLFNYLAKQNTILVKFFKKKVVVKPENQIDSFSILKKNSLISNYSTSSDNEKFIIL